MFAYVVHLFILSICLRRAHFKTLSANIFNDGLGLTIVQSGQNHSLLFRIFFSNIGLANNADHGQPDYLDVH
jgi:hypothetical protein